MTSPEQMTALEAELRSRLAVASLDGLDGGETLDHLARLIDLSFIFNNFEGTQPGHRVGRTTRPPPVDAAQTAILNYYLSNAWANRRQLQPAGRAGRVEVGTAGDRKADHPPSPCAGKRRHSRS